MFDLSVRSGHVSSHAPREGAPTERNRRRGSHGQATMELAIFLPLLVILSFGVFDLGSALSVRSSAAGAGRAGLRVAQSSPGSDVGAAIRGQAVATVPNTAAAWGGVFGTPAGDTGGCPSSFFTGSPVPQACFSVGACTLNPGLTPPTCTSPQWGIRPGTGGAVMVKVVYRVVPLTPAVRVFTTSGAFLVGTTVTAVVGY